ncbi:MAG: hypothetical protein ACJAVN_002468 [Roseivirga sp.]|jgi:hypothetical protein
MKRGNCIKKSLLSPDFWGPLADCINQRDPGTGPGRLILFLKIEMTKLYDGLG